MNYFDIFKQVGITEDAANVLNTHMAMFDMDNNCEISFGDLLLMIDNKYSDSGFFQDLSGFILDISKLYKETGINLGGWFFEMHFKKEYRFNLLHSEKIDIKMIFNLNGYIENLFLRMWKFKIKSELEKRFSELDNNIKILKRNLMIDMDVPEEAINFILESEELKRLSYFLIKAGFKSGLLLCLAYNTLYFQLEKEAGFRPPEDWPKHLLAIKNPVMSKEKLKN